MSVTSVCDLKYSNEICTVWETCITMLLTSGHWLFWPVPGGCPQSDIHVIQHESAQCFHSVHSAPTGHLRSPEEPHHLHCFHHQWVLLKKQTQYIHHQRSFTNPCMKRQEIRISRLYIYIYIYLLTYMCEGTSAYSLDSHNSWKCY